MCVFVRFKSHYSLSGLLGANNTSIQTIAEQTDANSRSIAYKSDEMLDDERAETIATIESSVEGVNDELHKLTTDERQLSQADYDGGMMLSFCSTN